MRKPYRKKSETQTGPAVPTLNDVLLFRLYATPPGINKDALLIDYVRVSMMFDAFSKPRRDYAI